MGTHRQTCLPILFLLHWLLSPIASSSVAAVAEAHPDYHPLQAFRSSADPASAALPSWAPDSDPCSGAWAGVGCRGGRVTRVLLQDRGLRGPVVALSLLPHLRLLNLSRNRLTGEIPVGLLRLRRLRRLDLSSNLLSGRIPPEMGRLPRLVNLRLEGNLFTGEIPSSLGSLEELVDFNISDNRLLGKIPPSLSSFPVSSFRNNTNLCGAPLVRQCTQRTERGGPLVVNTSSKDHHKGEWKLVATSVGIAVAVVSILVLVLLVLWCRRKGRRVRTTATEVERRHGGAKAGGGGGVAEEKRVVFFEGCRAFTVDDLMTGSAEMLGKGTVGTTYRVVMEGDAGMGLVVKRVRKGQKAASAKGKEEREVAAAGERLLAEIGSLRHPKVVGLRAYYHTDDELLLVYDYLPNGSLHSLLHGSRGPGRTPLSWPTRLKLAQGAAEGLTFLHGASVSRLAHQHFTSSNILVDDDGNACISDFGLLQLLSAPPPAPPEWYPTAPELLSGSPRRATQKSDVYGFGVVLLEVLTGRAAVGGEVDLAKWVQTVVKEEWTSEVFDVELVAYKEAEDEMVALLQVALLCLAPSPGDRPNMRVVFKMIEDIKERGSRRRRGSSSPSSLVDSSHESSTPAVSEGTPTFTSS